MRVRTKREGVGNRFAAIDSLSDITSTLVTPHEVNRVDPHTPAFNVNGYNMRIGSRTAFLLQGVASPRHCLFFTTTESNEVPCLLPTTGANDSELALSPTERGILAACMCAGDEIERHKAFLKLSCELEEVFRCRGLLADTGDSVVNNCPLFTVQVSRELLARWVMQSLNETTRGQTYRDTVTLLDRGATVRLRNGDSPLQNVVDMADMVDGHYWVELETTAPQAESYRMRVDRNDVLLHPPQPVYFDPLLPADELNNARGTSSCLFLAATLAIQRLSLSRENAPLVKSLRNFPKKAALHMARFARDTRKELHARLVARHSSAFPATALLPRGPLEVRMARDCVTLRYEGREIEVLQRTLMRLSLLWDARVNAERRWTTTKEKDGGENDGLDVVESAHDMWQCAVAQQAAAAGNVHIFVTAEAFFVRTFTMLLRYMSLFGDMGYNQGPHAAVPPVVLQQMHDIFDVSCEAFASPINAQLPRFASLFPDTDHYFGSIGTFFDILPISGHYEVNPPFVTFVLQKLQTFLLQEVLPKTDAADDPSLLFVIVLPSHDLDDAEREISAQSKPRHHGGDLAGNKKEKDYFSSNDSGRGDDDDKSGGVSVFGKKRGRLDGCDEKGGQQRSTERVLRESVYCLAHTLCAANESAYIDGHQHLLRSPFFCINTPTRLIVLGNSTARRRYSDAAARLAAVKTTWCNYTMQSKENETSG